MNIILAALDEAYDDGPDLKRADRFAERMAHDTALGLIGGELSNLASAYLSVRRP